MLDEWEHDMEVRDRFRLMAFGLERRLAWRSKRVILNTVDELKRRLRIVLFRYIQKRDEKKFMDL